MTGVLFVKELWKKVDCALAEEKISSKSLTASEALKKLLERESLILKGSENRIRIGKAGILKLGQ